MGILLRRDRMPSRTPLGAKTPRRLMLFSCLYTEEQDHVFKNFIFEVTNQTGDFVNMSSIPQIR